MTAYIPTWKIWIKKATTDLMSAKILLDYPDEGQIENSVYHCQQSTEKAIKGYLTYLKVRFGKTHDIGELLGLLAKTDSAFSESLKSADTLTVYATAFRYPEEGKVQVPLTRDTANKAYTLAKWILLEIQTRLPR